MNQESAHCCFCFAGHRAASPYTSFGSVKQESAHCGFCLAGHRAAPQYTSFGYVKQESTHCGFCLAGHRAAPPYTSFGSVKQESTHCGFCLAGHRAASPYTSKVYPPGLGPRGGYKQNYTGRSDHWFRGTRKKHPASAEYKINFLLAGPRLGQCVCDSH